MSLKAVSGGPFHRTVTTSLPNRDKEEKTRRLVDSILADDSNKRKALEWTCRNSTGRPKGVLGYLLFLAEGKKV